jgi:hypothetical protein
VLFDSPPIAALADGLILTSLSDLAVFVVRTGLTKPADLKAAVASLTQGYTPIAGMVVFEELTAKLYYGNTKAQPTLEPSPGVDDLVAKPLASVAEQRQGPLDD